MTCRTLAEHGQSLVHREEPCDCRQGQDRHPGGESGSPEIPAANAELVEDDGFVTVWPRIDRSVPIGMKSQIDRSRKKGSSGER